MLARALAMWPQGQLDGIVIVLVVVTYVCVCVCSGRRGVRGPQIHNFCYHHMG